MTPKENAIVVTNLQKSYKDLKVLRRVSFKVKRGTILALLGPNGAGKTTTIKILSTLLLPDGGKAQVDGYDVVSEAEGVRTSIGLTGQYAAVDEYLTGKENLQLVGRLFRLNKSNVEQRTDDLLEQFDLTDAAKRAVKTYSGGMRRRLDLAMSLIAAPSIIFLDEPTTGLDPRSRMTMWAMIKKLAADGTTILLTTQYMDEADQLADNIVVLDDGKVIAEGTAPALKSKVGKDRLELTFANQKLLEQAVKALGKTVVDTNDKEFSAIILIKDTDIDVKKTLDLLAKEKVRVQSMAIHKPTLDDVFLSLTGRGTSRPAKGGNNE